MKRYVTNKQPWHTSVVSASPHSARYI